MSNGLSRVSLFVDGSCIGNPGPGGWAAILECNGRKREIVGGERHTTNNRMELYAVIAGLKALKQPCQVKVVTDAQYVVGILNGNKAKANLDLVTELRRLTAQHHVTVEQVSGHVGHPMNERCDQLARAEAERRKASHQ